MPLRRAFPFVVPCAACLPAAGEVSLARAAGDSSIAPGWSPLVEFGGPGAIGSPGGMHPVAAAGDTVHMVRAKETTLRYRRSRDRGRTWGHAAPITDHRTAQYPCSLELSGDALHLIWPDGRDRPRAAYSMCSRDGGITWGAPERLTAAADGECWAEAVGGAESYAIAIVRRGDRLCWCRRDIRTGAADVR